MGKDALSTLLVTGATGYLGHALLECARQQPGLRVLTLGRSGCDLELDLARADEPSSFSRIAKILEHDSGCRLIHAAALSRIDSCRHDPDLADCVNHRSTRTLAALAGARMIQVSTDLVFGGPGAPFKTTDPVQPLSEYGLSKARAEGAALHHGATVARLPLLFGRSFDGRRGASDMLRQASGTLSLFENEYRTPLHVADAARLLLRLAADSGFSEIHHLSHGIRLSRLELGRLLLDSCPDMPPVELLASKSEAADRPKDVSLMPTMTPQRTFEQALATC